jgi:triacylglycerol esterase/lipase EstA (alpha/beta hydrolase family)
MFTLIQSFKIISFSLQLRVGCGTPFLTRVMNYVSIWVANKGTETAKNIENINNITQMYKTKKLTTRNEFGVINQL